MASVTIDKKQIPQVIALGVLTLGLFGYFISKMIVVPPSQASTTPTGTGISSGPGASGGLTGASGAPAADATPDPSSLIGAGAPSDTMRDPFTAASPIATPAPASAPPPASLAANPTAPSIPGLGQIKPLPLPGGDIPSLANAAGQPSAAAPAQDVWQLTGIIQSDRDPSNALAIMRNGDQRRYLRLGDQLDDHTRLVGIGTDSVTLVHDGQRVQLGVSSTISTQPAAAAAGSSTQTAPASNEPSLQTQLDDQPLPSLLSQPIPAPAVHAQARNSGSSSSHAGYRHDAAD